MKYPTYVDIYELRARLRKAVLGPWTWVNPGESRTPPGLSCGDGASLGVALEDDSVAVPTGGSGQDSGSEVITAGTGLRTVGTPDYKRSHSFNPRKWQELHLPGAGTPAGRGWSSVLPPGW